jgi:hypothetical protein
MNNKTAYIHRTSDPIGAWLYTPRDAQGQQIANDSNDQDEAHRAANDAGYMHTFDVYGGARP